jgi:hypothetical protein
MRKILPWLWGFLIKPIRGLERGWFWIATLQVIMTLTLSNSPSGGKDGNMKTDFEIVAGRDYQGDKCYRINYIEYDTLYTIPETHYTKKAAKEALKKIKAENDCGNGRMEVQ